MARLAAAVGALLLLSCAAAGKLCTSDGCSDAITGYSATYGTRVTTKTERFSNQTGQWKAKGAITKINAYYDPSTQCVQGIKVTYGPLAANALLLGKQAGLTSRDLTLTTGEVFNQVQVKAGSCIEYIRFATNKSRALSIGNSASVSELRTTYPNKRTGFVGAIRGYEAYSKYANGTIVRGPMDTLQIVWANCQSLTASPAPPPSPSPAATAVVVPRPAEPATPKCPSILGMCNPSAASTSGAYCVIKSPFIKRTCVGGCCASSGRCASTCCGGAGIGKEVTNTICYGLNAPGAIGASAKCAGLACWLAVPGCTSSQQTGACVGTVVDFYGTVATTNAAGADMVGYPCLDVSTANATLDNDGTEAQYGQFAAKLWTVCDCNASAVVVTDASAATTLGQMLNITSLTDLVTAAIKGVNASHPLQSVLDAVRAEVPALVVPRFSAANLTNALGFLGSLVGNGSGVAGAAATPLAAVVNLVKGAGVLSAAANSSNPLGAVLNALGAGPNNATNPLVGLAKLVSALSPLDADTTDKSDVLSAILGAIKTSTGASPATAILGAVTSVIAGGEAARFNVTGLLKNFHVGATNASTVVATIKAAIADAKAATVGKVDLASVLKQLQSFIGGGKTTSTATTTAAGPAGDLARLNNILSGIRALTGTGATGTTTAAANGGVASTLALLTSLVGGGTTATTTAGASGKVNLHNILDVATTVAPLIEKLGGVSTSASSSAATSKASGPMSAVLSFITGSGANGLGVDLPTLATVFKDVSPLLQILGGKTVKPTTSTSATSTTTAGAGASASMLSKVLNLVSTVRSTTNTASGIDLTDGISMSDLTNTLTLATQAAPVLQAITAAAGTSGSILTKIQSFLDSL